MNYRLRKLLEFALIFLALTGCKIRIDVPVGGKVTTASGAYECQSGQVCMIDIYDLYFDEEFIAIPAPGFDFVEWKRKDKGLCAEKATPCGIVSAGAQGNEDLIQLLESDEVFYLEPVFEKPSEADLKAAFFYNYGCRFKYCDRKGRIWYEIGIINLGPAVAKNVVVTFEEELFKVPTGWQKDGCTSRFGAISCPIGDLGVASQENNWTPTYYIVFRSNYFKNKKKQQHRVKFTVSGGSEDLNLSNNIQFWEQTILPFPKNQAGCDWLWNN